MGKSIELFSSFIFIESIKKSHRSHLTEALNDCYRIQQTDRLGQKWSLKNYPQGFTSYSSLDQLHLLNSNFFDLSEAILKVATTFAKKLNLKIEKDNPLSMTQFWINVQSHGGFHSGHIHPQSSLSGTLYLKTPQNCGPIRFEDPRIGLFMGGRPFDLPSKKNNLHFDFHPKDGDLVMFPSWMRHEVPFNFSKQDRVSLSFNIF